MNWSLNWRSPNVFLTWLLLRLSINIFQVSCEGRHDLYIFHPLLNGFYGLRRMWWSACGPGLWPFQCSARQSPLGPFLLSSFSAHSSCPALDGDMGRGPGGHPALVSEATMSPGQTDILGPWKQGKESSLRRMGGHLEGKAFLLEAPQACLQWSLKPLIVPFFPDFLSSSCFHHQPTHLSLSLSLS